jgi:hypothetical protein
VHDALLVRGREAVRNLNRELDRLAHGHRSIVQSLSQCLAVQQLRDDVWSAVVLSEIVHREDVWVVQSGCGARFLFEAAETIGIGGERHWQDLDCDIARETRVPRSIHLAHAARSDRSEDFVWTEASSWHQSHWDGPEATY